MGGFELFCSFTVAFPSEVTSFEQHADMLSYLGSVPVEEHESFLLNRREIMNTGRMRKLNVVRRLHQRMCST